MRFLIDTNILISAALFPEGKVSKVFSYILETYEVVICTFSIAEVRTVFARKFPEKQSSLEEFLTSIELILFETPRTTDPKNFPNIRDVKDVPILASAILSGVDVLLSGDKDFQGIEIERPLIYTPGEYLELIEQS